MRTHIKVVAIINIILGALGVLGGLGTIIGGSLGSLGALMGGQFVGAITGVVGSLLFGIIFGCMALFRVMAGFGLMKGAEWARFTIIVLSVFGLLSVPVGTIFSIYSLWVLLSAEGKREFTTVGV